MLYIMRQPQWTKSHDASPSLLLSGRMHPDSDTIRLAARQCQVLLGHRVRLHALKGIEPLQQPHGHIARLGECELLAQTDPRPPVERQKLPADLAALPPLRPELVRVRAPDILAALCEVDTVVDGRVLGDKDRIGAVGPAPRGQHGVVVGPAAVDGHDGVQAEDLVVAVLQVLAALEAGKGDLLGAGEGPELLNNSVAQLLVAGRVLGEQVEQPAEHGGGGVAAGEQDVHELGAQLDGVLALLGQGVEEDVLLLAAVLQALLAQVLVEGAPHEVVHELVALADRLAELGRAVEPVEGPEVHAPGEPDLAPVEVEGEVDVVDALCRVSLLAVSGDVLQLGVRGLSEEELGGRVEREAEEQDL